jgi:succinyl-diaminopimelate desuccinylase
MRAFEDIAAGIDDAIEAAREDMIALLADLVAAESENPPADATAMLAVLSGWLSGSGLAVEFVGDDPAALNIVCAVRGARPGKHVVFNAHMDTMPAGDHALWSVPPHALTRRDGRLIGLGAGNMKGALAAMCVVMRLLHERREALAGRATLTAVSDEVMFGDRGAGLMLARRPDLLGDYLISGEGPGFMDLAVAEKGLLWLDVEAVSDGGHSSNALAGRTAAGALSAMLARVDQMNTRFAGPPPDLPGVSGGAGNLGFRLSVNIGDLEAGGVRSQIATAARAQLDIRLPPGVTADAASAMVAAEIPDGARVTIRTVKAWDANWTSVDSELVNVLVAFAARVRGAPPRLVVRLPGSDARRWREACVPAVCYGPQPLLSAGVDDFIEEQDLIDCAKIYARAALTLMQANGSLRGVS